MSTKRPTGKKPGTGGAPQNHAGKAQEQNGPKGAEPTRYGDWETRGICRDF